MVTFRHIQENIIGFMCLSVSLNNYPLKVNLSSSGPQPSLHTVDYFEENS